jgi:hypothetical protein
MDSLFGSSLVDSTLTDTSYTLTSLQHDQRWWWRVRAHNQYGWGAYSDVRTFLVYQQIPGAPTLLDPPDGATDVPSNPTLSWNATEGADGYALQVSDAPTFTNLIVDQSGIGTSSYNVTGLGNLLLYYWRVSGSNALGTSPWSETWSFTTSLTGVEETPEQLPASYTLNQNYPNPFNPSTTIRYGLPERAHVRLEVFNMLGQSVALLVNEDKEAGWYTATFGGSSLASGVYLYRLTAGNVIGMKKLILLR